MKTTSLCNVAPLALVLALGSFSAQAEESSYPLDEKSIAVRLTDLDLAKPDEAATLLARIRVAAKHACTREGDNRVLRQARARAECRQTSYANTLSAINAGHGIDVEAIAARATAARALANNGN